MATIVNTPAGDNGNNSLSVIVGAVLILTIAVLFIFYGLPMLRQSVPAQPQINVPSQIDVNVKGNK